ncbi:uncharacterized protein N7482_007341 [Penicillium canariense]|uniref:Uncharacterized protein n=1 Tax=Penicillium canariense TaxID=189055 RepID=A0A9W9LJ09_9EURO|nr:uncharacterized protein N7482_007341 [Penicillium canariense]KAJ5160337.1 hypothetical protein N7482_007341 [Penicillium canariense]
MYGYQVLVHLERNDGYLSDVDLLNRIRGAFTGFGPRVATVGYYNYSNRIPANSISIVVEVNRPVSLTNQNRQWMFDRALQRVDDWINGYNISGRLPFVRANVFR